MKIRPTTLFVLLFLASCTSIKTPEPTLQGGFGYSSYGPAYNPGPDYWPYVGEQMAAKFPGAKPATIWIVGNVNGTGTYLNFNCETDQPLIRRGCADMNEDLLTTFDGAFRFAFTFVISIGFVAFYPPQLFLRPQDISNLVYFSPIIGAGLFILTYWLWKKGVNSYTGTGS